MIVTKSKNGFHIINHSAHGLLAGKLASLIDKSVMPEQWFETIIAVTEHDDRQLNFSEKNYLSDHGIPMDFTEESETVTQILKRIQRVINSVDNKSNWVRLLVSYHIEFLYKDLRKNSKKIKKFLDNENEARTKILAFYNLTNKKGNAYYEILRFCDRLSLILCKNEVPVGGRKLEINNSINNTTYFVKKSNDDKINVEPWIFSSDQFNVSVEEKIVNVAKFNSSRQFEMILSSTPVTTKAWKFANA